VLDRLLDANPDAAGAMNIAGQKPAELARIIKIEDRKMQRQRVALLETATINVEETSVVPSGKVLATRMGGTLSRTGHAQIADDESTKRRNIVVAMSDATHPIPPGKSCRALSIHNDPEEGEEDNENLITGYD